MDTQTLRQTLDCSSGTLNLSRNDLGGALADLLDTCYQGQALVISGAKVGDNTGDNIVITGRASLLNVADLPIAATFSVTADGQAQAVLRFQLRDSAPGPAAWTFTRSFPKLPTVWNYATGYPLNDSGQPLPAQKPLVDSLDLLDSCYVLATRAGTDPDTGVPLEAGINFVSKLRPSGAAGVLEHTLGDGKPLTIYGAVHVPKVTDRTLALQPLQRIWDRPDAPGIHLQAPLAIDFKLGAIELQQPKLRLYTPPSSEWQAQNASFAPAYAYTARLAIPSANIDIDLFANLEWGLPRAFLYARCSGLKLSKLAQLADVTGTGDLGSSLPSELQSAVEKLGSLELMDVGFTLRADAGLRPTVSSMVATVGMPGLEWKVWDDHFVVRAIACRFEVIDPFGKPQVAITLTGTMTVEGVGVEVLARRDKDGWRLTAQLAAAKDLYLSTLIKNHSPGVDPPAELAVSTLAVTIAPGRYYAMAAALSSRPKPWVIPLGKSSIAVNDVMFDFKVAGGKTTGSFSGTATFGKILTLSVGFTIPGSFAIRGTFPKVNLTHIIEDLCDQKVALPGGFDIILENASILIQKAGDNYTFLAGTSLKEYGNFALQVRKAGGGWGFAAGIDMGASGLSKLPGLGGLKSIEDSFKLRKLMLVISSIDDAAFTFPDMAQFNQPALATGSLKVPTQASGVVKGLMAFAEWQLDDGTKELKLLKNLLGLGGTQSATLAIGANPLKEFRLYVRQRTTIQKLPFDCQFGISLTEGKPSFFLTGSLQAKIQGQVQTFDVTTAFVPGGAFLSATMRGATAVDCGPFKLSNLALQIGANWAGIPSLGIAATIDVKNFSSSVAIFFDSTDPSRSLVAGSISEVNAKEILNAFLPGVSTPIDDVLKGIAIKGTHQFQISGDLGDELDGIECDKVSAAFAGAKVTIPSSTQQLAIVPKTRGAAWHLTNLTNMRHYQLEKKGNQIQVQIAPQFYFAPQATSIGTIMFPQGFYLNAAISFGGFDAVATIDISTNKGIAVAAQMDKIVIFDEKVFSLAALQGEGGPKIDISTFSQPDHKVAEFRLPHFYINGAMTLLGVKQGVYASVTTQGIEFELVGDLVPGVHFDVDARFGKGGFVAGGNLKVGVGTIDLGPLGKAKINTSLDVSLDIDVVTQAAKNVSAGSRSWNAGETVLENEIGELVFEGNGVLTWYDTTGVNREARWVSPNKAEPRGAQLAFQGDGNLVIYNSAGNPIWASNTNGSGANRLTVQNDGNVVLYDGAGRPKWATNTSFDGGNPGAFVELDTAVSFLGQNIDIPKFRVEASGDALTKVPKHIEKKIAEALNSLFGDVNKWMNAVSKGAMEGVEDTEKVFQDVYKKSSKEAKALAKNVNKGLDATGKAFESAGKEVENIGKDVGKGVSKAGKSLKKAFHL